MKHINIKINGIIPGYHKDQIVSIAVDNAETPYDELWRRRLKDAKRDNCCEIVRSKPKTITRSKTTKRENKT